MSASSAKAKGQGKSLWIAIGIAVGVFVLGFFALRHITLPKSNAATPGKKPASAIAISRLDGKSGSLALQEQVALYDPTPLFLPTPINSSDPALPATLQREPGTVFHAFPARYAFTEYEMRVSFPEPIVVPQGPLEGLTTGRTPNPFFTLGRLNYDYQPLPARGAFIEVMQTKTGRTVLAGPLDFPEGERRLNDDWTPIELVAAVDAIGLVSDLTVTTGSGSDDVDNFFRDYIAKQFRLGERLRPGIYTVRVGP